MLQAVFSLPLQCTFVQVFYSVILISPLTIAQALLICTQVTVSSTCCAVGSRVGDGVEVLEQAQHSRWKKAQAQQLTWPA